MAPGATMCPMPRSAGTEPLCGWAVELDRVEAFVTIVRKGGFTRAAAALHLSQPAISRRVRLLEHEVGASLFERGRSGGAHFCRPPRGSLTPG